MPDDVDLRAARAALRRLAGWRRRGSRAAGAIDAGSCSSIFSLP